MMEHSNFLQIWGQRLRADLWHRSTRRVRYNWSFLEELEATQQNYIVISRPEQLSYLAWECRQWRWNLIAESFSPQEQSLFHWLGYRCHSLASLANQTWNLAGTARVYWLSYPHALEWEQWLVSTLWPFIQEHRWPIVPLCWVTSGRALESPSGLGFWPSPLSSAFVAVGDPWRLEDNFPVAQASAQVSAVLAHCQELTHAWGNSKPLPA